MNVVPFKAWHLESIMLQEAQAYQRIYVGQDFAKNLEFGTSFTAMEGEQILGCGGLVELWQNRALVWSFVAQDAGKHFTAIHKTVMRFLEASEYARIEAHVDCEFEAGHRWIKMLGFTLEAERMRCFRPDGGDSALYSRVK